MLFRSIVSQGDIVADDTPDRLVASQPARAVRARIQGQEVDVRRQLGELFPGKEIKILLRENGVLDCTIDCGDSTAPIEESLARLVVKNNWALHELRREKPTLEDVFRRLTLQASREALHA